MATNWVTVTGAELAKVINWNTLKRANENLDESSAVAEPQDQSDPADTQEENRRDAIVAIIVEEVRSAIQNGGRYPLAVTASTVPPEAKRHVLNMAAWQLINSMPNLNMAILTEKGVSMPFANFYQEAKKYIEGLQAGMSLVQPTDPTGQDYLTAVSDSNPSISGVQWGDVIADDKDYENGYVLTSDGVRVELPSMNMNTF